MCESGVRVWVCRVRVCVCCDIRPRKSRSSCVCVPCIEKYSCKFQRKLQNFEFVDRRGQYLVFMNDFHIHIRFIETESALSVELTAKIRFNKFEKHKLHPTPDESRSTTDMLHAAYGMSAHIYGHALSKRFI